MRRLSVLCAATALFFPALSVAAPGVAHADGLPALTIGDTSVWEGDAGSTVVTVPVDLSSPSTTKVTVQFTVTSDTATAGSDFVAHKGMLTFPAGIATRSISVKVYGDTTVEPDEHVAIVLSNPKGGATLAKADGGVTILDDDTDGVDSGIEVNVGDVSVDKANYGYHVAEIPVTLSRPAPSAIKIEYSLQCGTAAEGSDYSMTTSGTLTFAKNQTTKYLKFTVAANTLSDRRIKRIVQNVKVLKGPAVVGAGTGEGEIVDTGDGSGDGTVPPLQPGEIRRLSVASDGSDSQPVQALCGLNQSQLAGSTDEAISADGRYVAFVSDASNLVPDDTNFTMDTFVRDIVTGTTERVSVQNDGSEFAPQYSINEWQTAMDNPAISADGRYVTFLNENDGQLYLRDRVAETTEMVSVDGSGHPGNGRSRISSISADGRYVAFSSESSNLDPTNIYPPRTSVEYSYLYVRDRLLGTTKLILRYAAAPSGGSAYPDWGGPAISANGQYVAFNDLDSTLVAGDTNNCSDTFVQDLTTGSTVRVSVDSAGDQQNPVSFAGGICSNNQPKINSDGSIVGFSSLGANLVASSPGGQHAYVHDLTAGTTDLVDDAADLNPSNPSSLLYGMSDDGRYVAWLCSCGDVTPGEPSVPDEVTMWTDRSTGVTKEVGDQPDGTVPIDENTGYITFTFAQGGLSADGLEVAFDSHATNLVSGDLNNVPDVFVEEMS